jgi:hypothetical protein
MTWKPTFAQLEIIEQHGNAHMPTEATAAALDVHPDDLRAMDRQAHCSPLSEPLCAATAKAGCSPASADQPASHCRSRL